MFDIKLDLDRVLWFAYYWPMLVIATVIVALSVFAFTENLKYRKLCRELDDIKEGCDADTKET